MAISDVLFEAVAEIREYQKDCPFMYDGDRENIDQLCKVMDSFRMREGYDAPPARHDETVTGTTGTWTVPELLEALGEAESVIRYAAQESVGRVKAEIVGGWLHHANKARAAIAKAN